MSTLRDNTMRPRKGDLYLRLITDEGEVKFRFPKDRVTAKTRALFDRISLDIAAALRDYSSAS